MAAILLPVGTQECQICQDGMKKLNNNRAFSYAKLVYARYLTRIFHTALLNLAPLTAERDKYKELLSILEKKKERNYFLSIIFSILFFIFFKNIY